MEWDADPGIGRRREITVVETRPGAVDVASLYQAHKLALVRVAVLLVDDQASAEDVVHDAFLALHAHAHRIRDPQAALGYLRTSVVNGSRSALRRRRTARLFARSDEPPHAAGADADLMVAEEHRAVLAAVRALPARQREVLVLRYWSGLGEAEIAETMGISRGAVKSAASRAIDKLERSVGDPMDDPS